MGIKKFGVTDDELTKIAPATAKSAGITQREQESADEGGTEDPELGDSAGDRVGEDEA